MELQHVRTTIGAQNRAIDTLEQTIGAQNQTIGSLEQTIDAQNQIIGSLEQTSDAQNQTIVALQQTVDGKCETIEQQQMTLEQVNSTLQMFIETQETSNIQQDNLITFAIGELARIPRMCVSTAVTVLFTTYACMGAGRGCKGVHPRDLKMMSSYSVRKQNASLSLSLSPSLSLFLSIKVSDWQHCYKYYL